MFQRAGKVWFFLGFAPLFFWRKTSAITQYHVLFDLRYENVEVIII